MAAGRWGLSKGHSGRECARFSALLTLLQAPGRVHLVVVINRAVLTDSADFLRAYWRTTGSPGLTSRTKRRRYATLKDAAYLVTRRDTSNHFTFTRGSEANDSSVSLRMWGAEISMCGFCCLLECWVELLNLLVELLVLLVELLNFLVGLLDFLVEMLDF